MDIFAIGELALISVCLIVYMIFLPAKVRNFPINVLFLAIIISLVVCLQTFELKAFDRDINLVELGLRFDNFWPAVRLFVPIAIVIGFIFIVAGLWRKKIAINRHFLITFFGYPLFAFAQQCLILGFFFQKFQIFFGASIINILLCAAVFSFLHYPDKLFMFVTFVGAVIWLWIFIQVPNLFASAFFHGWLGAMFYYFVLGGSSLENFLKQPKKE